jgi:predicted XRE-type DNA-binding protein
MSHKKEYEVTTDNVFADLGLESSDELIARAKLLQQVGALIRKSGLSQEAVAKKLGISQPKVSLLVCGRLSVFSTDTLFHYLTLLGCKVEIRVKQPMPSLLFHRGEIAVC